MTIAGMTTALLRLAMLAVAICFSASVQADGDYTGKVLYRYTDEHGVEALDDKVPPRYVAGGYEMLTTSGRVLKVIPPQLSGKELAEQQRRKEQQEADRKLLKRYNSLADIESARSRKLAIVEQDMAIMRSNIATLDRQIEQEQTVAARTQRNGGTVAPELLQRISDLRKEVEVLRERMGRRESEAKALNREFDRAATRYAEIAEG